MKRRCSVWSVLTCAIAMGLSWLPARGQGFIPTPPERLRDYPRMLSLDAPAALPSSVDLSADMPPAGQQTGNSCVAWAVGYYYKTFQEKQEHEWSVQTSDHQFSPYFIYGQVNGGVNLGSTFSDAFAVINGRGCAPLSIMPYTGLYVFPDQVQCEAGMRYRGDRATYIFAGAGLGWIVLDDMKSVLANGGIFVLGMPYYSDFNPLPSPYFYDGPAAGATSRGRHAVAIVGYDDNAGGGAGGFRCLNSWGTDWGDGGLAWLSYDFVGDYADEAWTMTDRIAYQPAGWARVDIDHPRRGQLVVRLGVGDPASPDFSRTVYHRAGGNYPDIHTSSDLTDGVAHLPPTPTRRWWVSVEDQVTGYVGTLTAFSVVMADNTKYLCSQTPLSIPDNGARVVAYVDGTGTGVTGVTINPGTPSTLDDLVAHVQGDPTGCSYAWYRDGDLRPGETTDTVSYAMTAKGQTWKCVVTPPASAPVQDEVMIANSAPCDTSASLSPADPKTGDDLVCSASASDVDNDAIGWTYTWLKGGVPQPEQTTNTISADLTAARETWTCIATPSDGTDDGPSGQGEAIIGNTAPAGTAVTIGPSSPKTLDDLVCYALATDADDDPLTWTYTWYRGGTVQPGETASTVDHTKTLKGETWKCVAVPSDGDADGPPADAQVTVGNTPPADSTASIAPANPQDDDDLVCSVSATDADEDPIGWQYAWYRNGVFEPGQTTNTIGAALTAKADTWKCVAIPNDGTDDGPSAEAQATVGNSPPSGAVVTISPIDPRTKDDLVATASADDPDGDPVTWKYEWYKDQVLQPSLTSDTVSARETAKGQTWKCVATPSDGMADGSPANDSVTVANTKPSRPNPKIDPGKPKTKATLTCAASATDDDGDPITYSYQWSRNGAVQPAETTSAVGPGKTAKGEVWECTVTPNDGSEDGPPASVSVTIGNTPPVVRWLGRGAYEQDGVHPDRGGPADTSFRFKVRVRDVDGSPPSRLVLRVQRLEHGREWATVRTQPLRPGAGDWATGRTCYATTRLPNGVFRYAFAAYDDEGERASEAPTHWHLGPRIVAGPQLWYSGLSGRESDTMDPDSGPAATRFRFSVLYTDGDGDLPRARRLELQRLAQDGRWRTCNSSAMDAWGGRPQTGKLYNRTLRLREGQYRHRFVFQDDDGPAVGALTRWQEGPVVGDGGQLAVGVDAALSSVTTTNTPAGVQVTFSLTAPASVEARVLNIAGRPVRALARGADSASGINTLIWDGRDDAGLRAPGGVYLIEVNANSPGGGMSRRLVTVNFRR